MILTRLDYDVPNLLNSDAAVAISRVEGAGLKRLVFLVREAGYGVIVVETASGDHYVIARAVRRHEGTLVGSTRKWSREHGYQFLLKRADERISALGENILALHDGRNVEIRSTHTLASWLTHWRLSGQEQLHAGYVPL